jgi:hypothetical protein
MQPNTSTVACVRKAGAQIFDPEVSFHQLGDFYETLEYTQFLDSFFAIYYPLLM